MILVRTQAMQGVTFVQDDAAPLPQLSMVIDPISTPRLETRRNAHHYAWLPDSEGSWNGQLVPLCDERCSHVREFWNFQCLFSSKTAPSVCAACCEAAFW